MADRPKGNHRYAIKATAFDGRVCKCGRLIPAVYKEDKNGFVHKEQSEVCDECQSRVQST